MCYPHWNSSAYFSKEDLVLHTRDYYNAMLYLGPGQGRPHPPDHGWQFVVQGVTGPKTSSGDCTKIDNFAWRFCVNRELHTTTWHHLHYCIPNPML
jgi:hypothetical protein